MAEITSVRKIKIKDNNIIIEFMYIAQYNRDRTYFNNLDFDTAEGESDDAIEYLNDHLNEYLDHGYLDLTKTAELFFKLSKVLDSIKFIDKDCYFKVCRDEFIKLKYSYYFSFNCI